ncbi:cell wall anchor protein [Mucilaginibacter rubeus]|uniref:Alginate lyase family protein n=1 Tax=Mucilaginibacter rubeus TaxID=2027860 RepID=A0AAE6JM73_9SPHI|nr:MULTISPECIES: alginate lyase family protein [Mucilaginibacter]QEM07172.1 cell wall anchor protein [Mucilaginibacter rubeus]QEM19628.1 cell wall anchor protein [Mucilaginibacter gossypii]QTE43679.1 alginate lyase family protein [Mucilaginibacter rubeus]QTE50279.1 alginate lyase family protein [Mucilaginibacter rubeus]QTE55366.1 alginate lyase family protein [Mucilaginibacter rubeus]
MKYFICYLIVSGLGGLLYMSCSKKTETGGIVSKVDTTKHIKPIDTLADNVPMKHSGGLVTSADFTRIRTMVAAGTEPWKSAWTKLIVNSHAQSEYTPHPTVKLIRGGNSLEEPDPDNYPNAMNDAAAAFQLAIRWKVSGDTQFADRAVFILNSWAATCTKVSGDPNVDLTAIYGAQFAIAAEMMRDYSGWKAADFTAYQQWMLNVFYSRENNFLLHKNGCAQLYWASWDLCNLESIMAIGILTDKRVIYNQAVNYLQHGIGNGNLSLAINNVFTGANAGLAQMQESGRDQGHCTLDISLLGGICQLAWNQGDDFFGYNDNLFLKACEYEAKYNVAKLDVPFNSYNYDNCQTTVTHTVVSPDARGTVRPMWEIPYNHYVKLKGLTATYTTMGAQTTRPEGGGGDYGPNSGGFDQLGEGTLLYSLP